MGRRPWRSHALPAVLDPFVWARYPKSRSYSKVINTVETAVDNYTLVIRMTRNIKRLSLELAFDVVHFDSADQGGEGARGR